MIYVICMNFLMNVVMVLIFTYSCHSHYLLENHSSDNFVVGSLHATGLLFLIE